VLPRLNLTALLAALAVADLVLERMLSRLFLPSPSAAAPIGRVITHSAVFISYLAGSLALFLVASTFVGTIKRRELFPRSMRFVVSVLALFFVVLFIATVSLQSPGRWFVQLKITHAFLCVMLALAVWRAPVGPRAKLGITLFALPAIFHTAALFCGEMSWTRGVALPGDLARIGELFALLAAGAAPLLLPSPLRGTRYGAGAWLLGIGSVGALVAGAFLKFDVVQVLALYGLRLDLPSLDTPGAWAYVLLLGLAMLGTFLLVVPALAAGGRDRLIGCGVIMMVTAGYQIASPSDLGVSMCGLLALALGITRADSDSDLVERAGAPRRP
jgi:hypothetical protein